MRLRERLRQLYPTSSERTRKQWIERGRIAVDGRAIRRGDAEIADDAHVVLGRMPPPTFPAPLRLVHDDEELLVVDKPAGLLTIATDRERERTAYRLLTAYVAESEARRVFVVHRLDRETSGLICFAKSFAAKRALQDQFARRAVERIYVALVAGIVRAPAGRLVSRVTEDRARGVRSARAGGGKEAITAYRVLERRRDVTLLELALTTGRRGQIRAQLAELGHPIVGDRAYGGRTDPIGRVCLHATRLALIHPRGHRVAFESPMPDEFGRVA